jgi:hypothetical protein
MNGIKGMAIISKASFWRLGKVVVQYVSDDDFYPLLDSRSVG